MQKKWKLNNKGMTLLEVIVAFAIFAVAATILFAGFNGAFKVIQNSNAIKDASQGSAGELEKKDYTIAPDEEKENVKSIIAKLPENKTLEITGGYFSATKNKSNDQTPITQTLFTAQTLVPKKIPEVPKDSKGVPVVPTPNLKNPKANDAYFMPDWDVTQLTFLGTTGNISPPLGKDNYPFGKESTKKKKTYFTIYGGELKKGVIDSMGAMSGEIPFEIKLLENEVVPEDEHLQQLFFVDEPSLNGGNGSGNGHLTYHVKFMYLGSNDNNNNNNTIPITLMLNKSNNIVTVQPEGTTALTLQTCEGENNTILYLPKDLVASPVSISGTGTMPENWTSNVLKKGFYEIPNNTDIIKAFYDDQAFKTFENYKKEYTVEELNNFGITAVEQP
ncbi:MAG: prepilin-type N-terminal cleavage/methylation domain-containing protein [Eubacterium sp.]